MAGERESENPTLSDQVENEKEESKEGEREKDDLSMGSLAPWEQHAAVINLPRYDYNAPSSFLQRSHSGFLITCPIKREKSATKEAISLLKEYIDSSSNGPEKLKPSDATVVTKKRKISCDIADTGKDKETESNSGISDSSDKNSSISLVKLSRSGLLLFSFNDEGCNVVQILSDIFHSLSSGKLKSPRWCHRIFPIQRTCILSEKELDALVSELFQDFLSDEDKLDKPIKFAVGYNRRCGEESDGKDNDSAVMDRENCFRIVAGAVKNVAKNSVVDLKSPEAVVLVELLPISGLPNRSSSVVGLSILPAELVSTKPRLCVKSLGVSNSKPTKGS